MEHLKVIGHTVSFFKSADKTITYGRQYFGNAREPFAIVVAGTTIYVVTSATDATLVLKNIENLTFDEYIHDMMLRFGTSPAAVDALWRRPSSGERQDAKLMPNPMRKCLVHLQSSTLKQQLLPGDRFQALSDHLLDSISRDQTWEDMGYEIGPPDPAAPNKGNCRQRYCTVELRDWTQEVFLNSATRTFFGDRLLDIEPELFKSFCYFDDNSWLFTYKIPKLWSKNMLAAKDVVQKALRTYFDLPRDQRPGASWMILSLEDEMRAVGVESRDIAAVLNMIFWVVNGNAYKLCFWILAHLLHDPVLYSAIKTEILAANIDSSTTAHGLPDRLEVCPHLDAVYHETLRLISSSTAVRDVATPMAVSGKILQRGTKILVPFRQLHLNESVWGSNARDFDPARFLSTSQQQDDQQHRFEAATAGANLNTKAQDTATNPSRNPHFRPFGGGTTICPGRFIARREVLAFVTLAIIRFDMTLADADDDMELSDEDVDVDGMGGRKAKFPRLDEEKPCLGLMGPAAGQKVFVKVIPRQWD